MIRKLQLGFIGTATLAVLIVITLALTLINVSVYKRENRLIQLTLDLLEANGGSLSAGADVPEISSEGGEGEEPKTKAEKTERENLDNELGPEYASAVRFFSARIGADGSLLFLDTSRVTAFTEETAAPYAQKVIDLADKRKKPSGRIDTANGNYAYRVVDRSGEKLVIVLDCTSAISNRKAILARSIRYGLAGVLCFMVTAALLSKRALRTTLRSIESQKQFITNAGHELKTPLAVISANVDVLELTEGKNEWLDSIRNQVKRLAGLTNRLIRLARIGEEEDTLLLTEIDYSAICRDAVQAFRPIAAENHHPFRVSIEDGIRVKAEADTLYELVSIFLDNACKYCDPEGEICLTLRTDRLISLDRRSKLIISNHYADGAGEDYSLFFERFYRSDTSHNASGTKGYGIGLSMAQRICELFRGSVSVAYKDGIISFTVIL